MKIKNITPCLWFDNQAEEAARFYTTLFDNSAIESVVHYGKAGKEIHGQDEGTVMSIYFHLNGSPFMALNGGPVFQFNEAISLQIYCDTQEEIDYFWEALTEGGEEVECGWLKDKFGLSWQVIPSILPELLQDPNRAERVMAAFLKMKKFDISKLLEA